MWGRRSLLFFAVLMCAGLLLWIMAPLAAADISGPCTGTLNGVDANSVGTPGTALEVPYNGSISVMYTSSGNITGHKVSLELAGSSWTVDEGQDDGNSWSAAVSIADYAKYGVGIYKVNSETYGNPSCTGTTYIKVTGKSPISTAAGAAGAAATGIGIIGMGGGAVASARKPDILDGVLDDIDKLNKPAPGSAEEFIEEGEHTMEVMAACLGCVTTIPMAILQTTAFMVVGAGGVGAPAPVIRWRPYLSVSSFLGALLAGLGSLVLAQQFALFYPSRVLSVIWLVVWLGLGLAIPSLTRLIGIRKANAIIARRLRETLAGTSATPPAAETAADVDMPDAPGGEGASEDQDRPEK